MKKLFAVMIVAALAFGVSACGEKKAEEKPAEPAAAAPAPAAPAAPAEAKPADGAAAPAADAAAAPPPRPRRRSPKASGIRIEGGASAPLFLCLAKPLLCAGPGRRRPVEHPQDMQQQAAASFVERRTLRVRAEAAVPVKGAGLQILQNAAPGLAAKDLMIARGKKLSFVVHGTPPFVREHSTVVALRTLFPGFWP
jgi:type IV secretory pathway VirB10-like protein